VPSDLRFRRGSNVYLRYGAFEANETFHASDQTRKLYLVDPTGRRVEDTRMPGRVAPDWAPAPVPTPARPAADGPGLFGRDLTVLSTLNQSAKGGVYLVQRDGRRQVLKEARVGTCADLIGRDARSALLNEWRILRWLSGSGLAPEPYDFFFAEDNAYLLEEYLPGATLRRHVERLNYRGPLDDAVLSALCARLDELVQRVRAAGVVLGDLTPNNVMVDGDRFTLIDLEHSALARSPEPRYVAVTLGYGDPADIWRPLETVDLDRTLAAIKYFVLTGIDPYVAPREPFEPHVAAALDAFAPGHPDGAAVRVRLAPTGATATAHRDVDRDRVLDEAVGAGRELVRRVDWDRRPWPWPQHWAPGFVHPVSFMSGTTGIVRYYLDLERATGDREWHRHAADLLEWGMDAVPFVAGVSPPGLYFGHGAEPWLMAELGAGSDDDAPAWFRRAVAAGAALDEAGVDRWDVTHGWAGIGLTQLAVLRRTGDDGARRAVARIVHRIVEGAVDTDGVPMWPQDDGRFYGFGHGSAGIGYFLLAAGVLTGDRSALDLAGAVGRSLVGAGSPVAGGRGLSWPHQPGSDTVWSHWCNGAAGVGAFLHRLAAVTGDGELSDAAVRAGRSITEGRPYGSCCRCHGLAGDGDFLLDLTSDPRRGEEFRAGAGRVARKLDALRIDDGSTVTWAHEGVGNPRPGYMRGFTGIHAFRLRLVGLLDSGPLTLPLRREELT
jgi:predicted Ser/Thr protein kinase